MTGSLLVRYGCWIVFYGIFAIGVISCLILSMYMNSTYRKCFRKDSKAGMTGAQTAERILQQMGDKGVTVCHTPGIRTESYDEAGKKVHLSDAVYAYDSIGSVGLAAYVCSHIVPYGKGRKMFKFQRMAVPLAEFYSILAWPLIIFGYLFNGNRIWINFGVLCFLFSLFLRLITLPFEFQLSKRALDSLQEGKIVEDEEALLETKKLLRASVWGYVAKALGL